MKELNLPEPINNAIGNLTFPPFLQKTLFYCTCGHPQKDHFCQCGEVHCAECRTSNRNKALGFHGIPKSICSGTKVLVFFLSILTVSGILD